MARFPQALQAVSPLGTSGPPDSQKAAAAPGHQRAWLPGPRTATARPTAPAGTISDPSDRCARSASAGRFMAPCAGRATIPGSSVRLETNAEPTVLQTDLPRQVNNTADQHIHLVRGDLGLAAFPCSPSPGTRRARDTIRSPYCPAVAAIEMPGSTGLAARGGAAGTTPCAACTSRRVSAETRASVCRWSRPCCKPPGPASSAVRRSATWASSSLATSGYPHRAMHGDIFVPADSTSNILPEGKIQVTRSTGGRFTRRFLAHAWVPARYKPDNFTPADR
jgi:hypothetical protein